MNQWSEHGKFVVVQVKLRVNIGSYKNEISLRTLLLLDALVWFQYKQKI